MQELVDAAAKLVGHFHSSSLATQNLKNIQIDLNKIQNPDSTQVFQPLSVIQYCKTRWNSIESMLRRLFDLKEALIALMCNTAVIKPKTRKNIELTSEQWQKLEAVLPILKILRTCTELFSYEKKPSLSILYPTLFVLQQHLIIQINDDDMVKDLKEKLNNNIESRFDIANCENSTAILATVLDPRFKNLPNLTNEQKNHVKTVLKDMFEKLKNDQQEQNSTQNVAMETIQLMMSKIFFQFLTMKKSKSNLMKLKHISN